MTLAKPHPLIIRPAAPNSYVGDYVKHQNFSNQPLRYIRAYELLEKDLKEIFEFIEPSPENNQTYSFRIHELFMRVCIEFEANCKSILKINDYSPKDKTGKSIKEQNWKIIDYQKIERSHRLSEYRAKMIWADSIQKDLEPFVEWLDADSKLSWYKAYNDTKHDRAENFKKANLGNLLQAISGLFVVLTAQFGNHDFYSPSYYVTEDAPKGYSFAIGDLFYVKYPSSWVDEDLYDFNWGDLKNADQPFDKFKYL